ncbi:MAG: alanine racemase [Arcobacteraceae bacterium]|nr:alanine racemase [Arcobacteraceae bacterium]
MTQRRHSFFIRVLLAGGTYTLAKIILNKLNYFHNLDTINQKLNNTDKIAVVLKDNAYGHGLMQIAKLANEYGIKKAVVRTIKEAEEISHLFDYILVLAETINQSCSHTFHIAINSLQDINNICKNTNVHLKIDTGMHRNGISIEELEEAIYRISKANLNLTGVFTHHRNSDALSSEFFWQQTNFNNIKNEVKNICEKLSLSLPHFHSLNSSGIFRCEKVDDDFVRIGIACYGYCDNKFPLYEPKLKPVASLVATRLSTTHLKKGQRIGYGGEFEASQDMVSSTYDIGYGDGFLRLTPNHGEYITPKGFALLGKVSMDSLSLDTNEEEVVIFDDVNHLAELHRTITYEILTSLSSQIKRVVK